MAVATKVFPYLTILLEIVNGLPGLITALHHHSNRTGGGNVTVLAPSDDAVGALRATKPDWNTDMDLWKYHILQGSYETNRITALPRIAQTLSGRPHDVVDLVVHAEETTALSAVGNVATIIASVSHSHEAGLNNHPGGRGLIAVASDYLP